MPTAVPRLADMDKISSQDNPGEVAPARHKRVSLIQSESDITEHDGEQRAASQYSIRDHGLCRVYRVVSCRAQAQF